MERDSDDEGTNLNENVDVWESSDEDSPIDENINYQDEINSLGNDISTLLLSNVDHAPPMFLEHFNKEVNYVRLHRIRVGGQWTPFSNLFLAPFYFLVNCYPDKIGDEAVTANLVNYICLCIKGDVIQAASKLNIFLLIHDNNPNKTNNQIIGAKEVRNTFSEYVKAISQIQMIAQTHLEL